MRKRIIGSTSPASAPDDGGWLNLDTLAEVEITSEDADFPIESALSPGTASGWRAAGPGPQTIRLRFDHPQHLRRIRLHFSDTETRRTQEYVLQWSSDDGHPLRPIVRQQWNFDPNGATSQVEDHQVDLPAVTVLELSIVPDISGGPARASLRQLRLA